MALWNRKKSKLKRQLTLEERMKRNLLESAKSSGVAPVAYFLLILFMTGLLYGLHPFAPPLRSEVYLFAGFTILSLFTGGSIVYYILAAKSQKRHIEGIGTMPCHSFNPIGDIEAVASIDENTKTPKIVRPSQKVYENGGLSNWPVNTGGRWAGFAIAPLTEVNETGDLQIINGVYAREFWDTIPPDIQKFFADGKADHFRWYSPIYRWVGRREQVQQNPRAFYDHVTELEIQGRSITAMKAQMRELQDYISSLRLGKGMRRPDIEQPEPTPGESEL